MFARESCLCLRVLLPKGMVPAGCALVVATPFLVAWLLEHFSWERGEMLVEVCLLHAFCMPLR